MSTTKALTSHEPRNRGLLIKPPSISIINFLFLGSICLRSGIPRGTRRRRAPQPRAQTRACQQGLINKGYWQFRRHRGTESEGKRVIGEV